jgi:hypothetical protein
MPKKKPGMTPEEQSEAFREKVRDMIAAGDLNPTEADERFESLMRGIGPKTSSPPISGRRTRLR